MVGFTDRKYDSSRLKAIADAAHYTTMLKPFFYVVDGKIYRAYGDNDDDL